MTHLHTKGGIQRTEYESLIENIEEDDIKDLMDTESSKGKKNNDK